MINEGKLIPEWRTIKRKTTNQLPSNPKAKDGEEMTLGEFIIKYPDYTTGVSTIYEPPLFHFIGKADKHECWFSVSVDELFEEESRMYEASRKLNLRDGQSAFWDGTNWIVKGRGK